MARGDAARRNTGPSMPEQAKAAYMIVTCQVHDKERFLAGYAPAAAEMVERFGGRYLLRAPGAIQLEGAGAAGASVVISQWPDRAAAEAFWNSGAYAEVRKLREGIADCSVLLVEALA